ncbi:MAG TPA: aminomethyl-transferring glycine dehydrogenase subunit GcvPB [Alphaproteobacteria bacterium]|nr:aminomethyl-transferring glycine dehydrogenase subunit GcvPB [Alphaproteobacteria bacterium]
MANKENHAVQGIQGLVYREDLIFEQSAVGRVGYSLPSADVPEVPAEAAIPAHLLRQEIAGFPEVAELDVVRHFTRLSQWNYGIDLGTFPLGSCTMKYNPRINEEVARLPGFARLHPYEPEELVQGALQMMYELERYLADISGMDRVTLQPAAGAHGELTGLLMIRAYHASKGNPRRKVILPDSAHGTNPASSALCGYQVVELKSSKEGVMDPQAVAEVMDEDVAALMTTNPNTLGIFEKHIQVIADIVHDKGGLVYCDGANLNALVGMARPGDMGFDVIQFNLHKTFSTPHGGGGPGAGPVGVKSLLIPFLPLPVVEKDGDRYRLDFDRPQSIGRVRAFYGNFGMLVRAYTYIRSLGPDGLRRMAETAVLNANYLLHRIKEHYDVPYPERPMHECVVSDKRQLEHGVKALDIAKRLIDYGYHPPTVYFPLIVKGALMIEPTESESKERLDQLAAALISIATEAEQEPETVLRAPTKTVVSRLNETKAAREPNYRWKRR